MQEFGFTDLLALGRALDSAARVEALRLLSQEGVPASTVAWCRALLSSTFAEIEILEADPSAAFSVLRFCQQWVSEHVGANLKSLNFLFTCGLF